MLALDEADGVIYPWKAYGLIDEPLNGSELRGEVGEGWRHAGKYMDEYLVTECHRLLYLSEEQKWSYSNGE